ncbi:alpha/beta hydrolase [Paenarthrobacter sp. NPDC090520]|uniref:alpha/beta hydrolase n=1 Tax=Paenarthrobacter sp. NPDC090520 TaxID=3364382 RepID=UPI0038223619
MERRNVEFDSDQGKVRGWWYAGCGRGARPVIVMAHGFSGVKEQYMDRYAEAFASAGLSVLVFDQPHFGASDGLPRYEVDPERQIRAYRDAVTFAVLQPDVDPGRVGVWGTSFSGGHALHVAATDRRVRCVVAQTPTTDGQQAALRRTPAHLMPGLLKKLAEDRAARSRGESPAMVPVTSDRAEVSCALAGAEAHRFFAETADTAPSWSNQVTLRSTEYSRSYVPSALIDRISPTPLLMIVADQDQVTPVDLQLEAYGRAREPKELRMIQGGHFTPYVTHFAETSAAAADWFSSHLGLG